MLLDVAAGTGCAVRLAETAAVDVDPIRGLLGLRRVGKHQRGALAREVTFAEAETENG